ncbi:recombinase family protein [Anaerospora hongkongensis]|uniref:recombinase family protein n=1 Tax=Anaerospora hongkongensis TaxID=244830 RepID=UPI002FDB348B
MNIAYVRVSTKEQNTGRQLEALKACNIGRTYEEKISAKDTNRPQLQKLLEFAREGDTVYVESFSRLARNMLDLLTIIDQLSQKNIGFVSLKEKIDTTTPAGRLQLNVFGAIYQFERECSKERQREGIDLALAEGRAYGRPKIEIGDRFIAVYKQWKNDEITAVKAMELTGLKKNTFYNRVKEYEQTGK